MKTNVKNALILSGLLLLCVIVYTFSVSHVDVSAIPALHADTLTAGPESAPVGFSSLNGAVSSAIGFRSGWYLVSKLIGILTYLLAAFFAFLGVLQLIKKRTPAGVDRDLYVLGGFYLLVLLTYVLFEILKVNYRPVILHEGLEASYPSTHTLLGICIFTTSAMQFGKRISGEVLRKCIVIACYVLMVVLVLSRLLSGVHWLTDIIGGILVSSFLVSLYLLGLKILDSGQSDNLHNRQERSSGRTHNVAQK